MDKRFKERSLKKKEEKKEAREKTGTVKRKLSQLLRYIRRRKMVLVLEQSMPSATESLKPS